MVLNESWMTGKYPGGEVNTSLSWVSVMTEDGREFFLQGHEAEEFISRMHEIWTEENVDQEVAFFRTVQEWFC